MSGTFGQKLRLCLNFRRRISDGQTDTKLVKYAMAHSSGISGPMLRGRIMKELTDTERLEIAVSLLSERDLDAYETECAKLEQTED